VFELLSLPPLIALDTLRVTIPFVKSDGLIVSGDKMTALNFFPEKSIATSDTMAKT
jgi:hypothetical protein